MSVPAVLILAAGKGTRMRSATPKMLHPVCGRPLLMWPVTAALAAAAERVVAILGPEDPAAALLPAGVVVAVQHEARGTGDAVAAARDQLAGSEHVVVISGDTPLVTAGLIEQLAAAHSAANAAMTIATTRLNDPRGYGRIVRRADGTVERVVETKTPGDATAAELAIDEVNTGIYVFAGGPLLAALERIGTDNAQGEYYLPDVLAPIADGGGTIAAFELPDPDQALGVNSRVDLARVETALRGRIIAAHQLAGVTVVDPASTWIECDVTIGQDTVIEPGTYLRGATAIGDDCRIGPHTTAIDTRIDGGASVVHSYLVECAVGPAATVGPFAYLRPAAELGERAKAGAFVELKNTRIGAGSKVPHLSYLGDAEVGENSNIGAGNITANYDGRAKHPTKIGSGVRTGVDTAFVAPVEIGDNAYTGAGSVITDDVPPGALGIARARQQNIEGFADRSTGDDPT